MCARHQTGVWKVPSCPLLEEKRSGNYLGFPTIPAKFGEISVEKIFDLAEGSANFAKNQTICPKSEWCKSV